MSKITIDPKFLEIELSLLDSDMTLRDYFKNLLATLWEEGECFSGKRPFGTSSWQWDVYKELISLGAIPRTLDKDGYVDECDTAEAGKAIIELIVEHL